MTECLGTRMLSHLREAIACLALATVTGGCFVDSDAPCGENQDLDDTAACVCVTGTGLADDGHSCVAMEPTPPGLGLACDEASAPCTDPAHPRCQASEAGDYCTSETCTSSDDCEAGYACREAEAASYCERPPIGQGATCTSDEDCSGGEATYCESQISNQCLVLGCDVDSCFEGFECCDLRPLGTPDALCVPAGECPV